MPEESRPKDEPKSRFDAFVGKVVGDPAKPQETLLLKGFLGASSEPDHTRIYTAPTLDEYVDIANEDIVHTEAMPREESPLGGHYIWVRKTAEVLTGQAGTDRTKSKFLEGPIAAQAAAAAGPAAPGPIGPVTVPVLACHPTLVVQFCRTHVAPLCPPPSPLPWHCPISHLPIQCPPSPLHLCPPSPLQFCPPSPLHFCPPSPLHFCPPSPPILHCPPTPGIICTVAAVCHPTPLCPTGAAGCPPPITVNQQQCVASGGGIGCPVDTPLTPQTPQGPGGGIAPHAFAAMPQQGPVQQAGPIQQIPQSVFWVCPPHSVPAWHCPGHSVFFPCPSVPVWHCPTNPILCQHNTFIGCQTVLQPQCQPVVTVACPVVTANCPIQTLACPVGSVACPGGPIGGPAGGPIMGGLQQAAGAPAPQMAIPQTIAPVQCNPSIFLAICPTVFCPSQHGIQCPSIQQWHCPSVHQWHCPSVQQWHCPSIQQWHCPTPACPTPQCPTNVCTEVGPHCMPTPNPVHCPTPNQMCPQPSVGFQCPSHVEICPTSSPIFCAVAAPGMPAGFAAGQAAAPPIAQQPIQVQPSLLLQCRPSVFCPPTIQGHFCPTIHWAWCPPRTFAGPQCFTAFCPVGTAFCPPQQSLVCGGGFPGGGFPGGGFGGGFGGGGGF